MQFFLNSSTKRSNIIPGTWSISMINICSELFMMLYLQLLNFKTDERENASLLICILHCQIFSLTAFLCERYWQQSVRCNATQTQSAQRKSSTATVKRSDPKGRSASNWILFYRWQERNCLISLSVLWLSGKTQGPKLDDGSGGFPPFRFGKGGGGGGGGGGGSNYFGGFLLFTCVLLLDYLKEFEKNLIARRQRAGYDANNDMFQQ